MKNLRQTLKYIGSMQSPSESDSCRLFYDGSIRTRTPTPSGAEGWLLIAGKIHGAGPMFAHFFVVNPGQYLKVRDLRQALELRDQMLIEATQDRTLRAMKATVRKEYIQEVRKRNRRSKPSDITCIPQEEPEEQQPTEVRTPSTVFF